MKVNPYIRTKSLNCHFRKFKRYFFDGAKGREGEEDGREGTGGESESEGQGELEGEGERERGRLGKKKEKQVFWDPLKTGRRARDDQEWRR